MIARLWSARTAPDQASAYAAHLKNRVLPELREIRGYAGSKLLQRTVSNVVEITVITFWQSLDSIRAFAGDDIDRAVVADEAAAALTGFDRRVRHYEVVVEDDV